MPSPDDSDTVAAGLLAEAYAAAVAARSEVYALDLRYFDRATRAELKIARTLASALVARLGEGCVTPDC